MALLAAVVLLAALPARGGPLDYADRPFQVEVSSGAAGESWTESEVRWPSPLKSPFKANDTVWAHFSLPTGPGPHPAILVLPVMAAPNIEIERRFIDRFRRDGFAVLWLEMPYQFHRRPHPSIPSGQVFLARTAKRLSFNFRQSVLDARRALAWLKRQPGVDAKKIGIFGISLGAMVGSAVYSVDGAPSYGVFLLGGADFPSLALRSAMTRKFVRQAGIAPEDLKREWVGIDPRDYRESNRGKEALLVNARWDHIIPLDNALKLRQAFPDSRQEWVVGGHYSAILHLVWMPRYVSRAFQRFFGLPR